MRFIIFCLCFLVGIAYAHHSSTIGRYIKSVNPNVNIGIEVKSLRTGKIIYQRNANRLFVPGSNMKILTAEAALMYLGPQYAYRTRLYSSGNRVSNGVLTGNLYFDFSGDPTLTMRDLDGLVKQLKKRGIRRIDGNVYLDDYGYDQDYRGRGWSQDDFRFCYSAPIDSIILSHNCMPFVIYPSSKSGYRAKLRGANTYFRFLKFSNQTRSSDRPYRCPLQMNILDSNTIALKGCVKRGAKPIGRSAAVNDVLLYGQQAVRYTLSRNGISVNGKVMEGHRSKTAKLVAYHDSAPLYKIINRMLKKSDNVYAESIFKKLGQAYFKQPGSWSNGELAVKKILEQHDHVDFKNVVIADGSGLSHYNLVSPDDLVDVLYDAYKNFPTNKNFYSALPISATDGTLKYRMKKVKGRVHAKTGTLNGVSALSGYVKTRRHGTYVFSIIINGFSGKQYPYRRLEDKIVSFLSMS